MYKVLSSDSDLMWFCKSCRVITTNLVRKLIHLERRLDNLVELDRRLDQLDDLERKFDKLVDLERKLDKLADIERKLDKLADVERRQRELFEWKMEMERRNLKTEALRLKVDALEQDQKSRSVRITGMTIIFSSTLFPFI